MDVETIPANPPDDEGVKKDNKYTNDDVRQIPYDDPFDLPQGKKWLITILLAFLTVAATFASSIFSSTITVTAVEFGVSETIMILGVSLYVLGFALGPLVWGPCSEFLGRRKPLFIGFGVFALMQIPIALTKSLAGILVCRLFSGCFAAAPTVLVGAIYADFWTPAHRGTATAVYSMAVYIGPTLGPIVGAFTTQSHLGWRWTAWLTLILAACVGIPAYFLVPETYGPVLRERAAKRSHKSGLRVEPERDSPTMDIFVRLYLVKPALMLIHEPLVRRLLNFHVFDANETLVGGSHSLHLPCVRDLVPDLLRLSVQFHSGARLGSSDQLASICEYPSWFGGRKYVCRPLLARLL